MKSVDKAEAETWQHTYKTAISISMVVLISYYFVFKNYGLLCAMTCNKYISTNIT